MSVKWHCDLIFPIHGLLHFYKARHLFLSNDFDILVTMRKEDGLTPNHFGQFCPGFPLVNYKKTSFKNDIVITFMCSSMRCEF